MWQLSWKINQIVRVPSFTHAQRALGLWFLRSVQIRKKREQVCSVEISFNNWLTFLKDYLYNFDMYVCTYRSYMKSLPLLYLVLAAGSPLLRVNSGLNKNFWTRRCGDHGVTRFWGRGKSPVTVEECQGRKSTVRHLRLLWRAWQRKGV
jgi:hypothetical protein